MAKPTKVPTENIVIVQNRRRFSPPRRRVLGLPEIKVQTENIVVFSDLHAGSQWALCPRKGCRIDNNGTYLPNGLQLKLADHWDEFHAWVKKETRGEPYDLVNNGDTIDGNHHGSTETITNNLAMQRDIAQELLLPIVNACRNRGGRYYHIRGTPAHSGESNQDEEALARNLEAVPDKNGNYARHELRKDLQGSLIQFMHHVGTVSSSAYEATAVHKELVEAWVEAARWGQTPPDMICRAHRHRFLVDMISTSRGRAFAVVGPAWQAKTSFAYRIAGARQSQPQFGGYIVRKRHGYLHVIEKVWSVEPPPIEV